MRAGDPRAHLAEALRWSPAAEGPDRAAILGAAVGMAGPILLGGALGHLPAGLAAALGGLMVGGVGADRNWRAQASEFGLVLAPAILAMVAAAPIAGRGWMADAGFVALAGIAATVGGFSRPMAVGTTRFILFLIIAAAVTETAPDRAGLVLLMLAGALWTGFAAFLIGAAARARRPAAGPDAPQPPQPTAAQKFARWRRSLTQLAGWNYALRLTVCVVIAAALRLLWPDHHLHWIALTVALLTDRQIEPLPVRTTQRALGTALGVLATGLLLISSLPAWALAVLIGALAALRPLLRARNYLAYSAVMTPLIVIIMDARRPLSFGLLADRLVATLIGAALVIAANFIVSKAVETSTRKR